MRGTTNIPTLIVAVYAAVVSSITGIIQILNYRRDRDKIKLTIQHDMTFFGDARYEGKTVVVLRVGNAGRRPVTIGFGRSFDFRSQEEVAPGKAFEVPSRDPSI